jgi:hypothetical protein
MDTTYKIIRFFKNGNREIVASGMDLESAKIHCNDPNTKGEDWFDGYEKECCF